MVGLIILTVLIIGFLIMWTKFNADETKSIDNRWEKLLKAEDRLDDRFKKIKSAVVTTLDGGIDEVQGVYEYLWNTPAGSLELYNAEGKALAFYKLSEITNVHFVREGDDV